MITTEYTEYTEWDPELGSVCSVYSVVERGCYEL